MDPENKKKKRGGARLQKEEKVPQKEPARVQKRPKPKRTRRQKILRALYITITVIAALIVGLFIAWNLFSAAPDTGKFGSTRKPQTTTIVDENGEEVKVEIPGLSADRKEQFYTFLLVGQDTLGGGNTDTMMLGAYDVPNQKLSIMSLPRDTYVKYSGKTILLNAVYNWAGGGDKGITALKEEVGELTGVVPDYHVIVQWEAVGELVDAIDGVWFDVPQRMYYNDLSQGFKIDLQAGYQLLDGDKAMQLIRWRKSSDDSGHSFGGYAMGDLGRIETQQAFMKAIIAKCLQPDVLLPNLTEYIRIFQKNVVTDLSFSNMAYFAKSAIGSLDMESVEFVTLPYKAAGQHLLPVASEIVDVVNASFNPYKDDILLSELDVATSAPASSSTGNTGTAATTTDTPNNEPDDPGVTDDPGTSEEPTIPNAPGTSDEPNDPGVTENPGVTEDPTVSDDPGTTADPEDPGADGGSEEPPVPPPPPADEAA